MNRKTTYYNEMQDFSRMENCVEKVEIAISRLEYPLGLDEEMIVMYQDYLFNTAPKIASQFIDLNKLSLFPLLVKYRVIKKANVLKLTEYAREKRKMDMLSYLMDVGNQFRTRPKQMDIAAKFVPGKSSLPCCDIQRNYSAAKAGDIVWLGKPLMPWQVLDNRGGRMLVISKYVLDCLPYEDFYKRNTFWNQSSIRKRLNSEYLYNLMTEEEIEKIIDVHVNSDDSLTFDIPDGEKGDKFFLLSTKEASRYFRDDRHRCAPVVKYATRSMLWTVFDKWAHWWLRTPGQLDADMFYVRDGVIMSINSTVQGSYFEHFGVRPAMYISVE